MAKVSIIIPARHEIYLKQTVDNLFASVGGDVEVIVILDGYWPQALPTEDPRLILVHRERQGMRASINSAVAIAKGDYILKTDAHCMFAPGFDVVLQKDCDKDWVVIPRRYALDINTWSVKHERLFVDYEYLGWPFHDKTIHGSKTGLHAWVWNDRTIERVDRLIDENMTFQGSCWLMSKEHFTKRLGNLQEEGYGTFIGEAQEIGLKTWLGGGKVMTNKKTWYAHLWKGQPYRQAHKEQLGIDYTRIGHSELKTGNAFCVDYWMNNKWEGRKHDLIWLIDRFMPYPSGEQWTHSNT
jgi:glycosyltransferase involved in cell wall biosynthesis